MRVIPKASKDEVAGVHDGALKVRVRAAPERGKANKAVICLLEQALSPFKFAIIRGETSQDKVASINATPEEVISRVEEFLAAARKA
ncbi:MAG: DUF167 domain-containing protein [Planctomycetes bacterium]|nr:DUF167 domain-containing protein [Planctomycetota bacterium]